MGWDSCSSWRTKADVIAEELRPGRYGEGSVAIAHKSTAQALYVVYELADKRRVLEVTLIEKHGGEYSRKGMSEESGPYVHDCPLRLLELVPEPDSEYAKNWRARVRAHHAKHVALRVGATVKLVPGVKYRGEPLTEATVASVKPLLLALDGTAVKVSKKLIDCVLT